LEEKAKYDTILAPKNTALTAAAIMRKGRTAKLATRYTMDMKNARNTPAEREKKLSSTIVV